MSNQTPALALRKAHDKLSEAVEDPAASKEQVHEAAVGLLTTLLQHYDQLDALATAAHDVIDKWESGNLAEAVRELGDALSEITQEPGDDE